MDVHSLLLKLSDEIKNSEPEEEIEEDLEDEEIPPMITNVYNLEHDVILKKVYISQVFKRQMCVCDVNYLC